MGAHAAADTAIVSLSRARVCQGSKIWNSHPNSQKIEANPPRFLPSRDLYCKKLEYELGYKKGSAACGGSADTRENGNFVRI